MTATGAVDNGKNPGREGRRGLGRRGKTNAAPVNRPASHPCLVTQSSISARPSRVDWGWR